MKPFFKPEDFTGTYYSYQSTILQVFADKANAKLEREGKIVFSQSSDRRYWEDPNDPTTQDASERSDLRALLINIEPIEQCTHPTDKVFKSSNYSFDYQCECGAKVKPNSFKEIP